jgi:O-antigen/teichoic acid export membrane protein/peptidoglycan/xylan/chitin deacetylase (PgdA/CDA1 family)
VAGQTQRSGLQKLIQSSGIYFLASAGQQAVGFLLLPLYTSVLAPADYGVLEILNTTGLISVMVLGLGLTSALMKCYHRDCASDDDRRSILPTALAIEIPILAAGCVLLFLFAEPVTRVMLGPDHPGRLVRLLALWVFLQSLSGLLLALFRSREEAFLLGSLSLAMFVLLMFLNIYFVWALKLGVEGVLLGNCASTAAATIGALILLRTRVAWRVNPALVRPLLGFGVLIVPVALSGWIMGMADRYFLKFYGQLAAVGVYSLGYKLGMVLEVLIVSPFQLAWPPFSFAISDEPDHRRVYARTLTYLTLVLSACVLGLSLLAPVALRVATHPDYFGAATVVPLIALSYAFNGVHYCVSPGIHLRRRTRWLPVLVAVAAGVNVALCIALIPRIGMMGAAWATMVSFALLAAATFAVSQAFYPVRYEYGRLARIAGGAVALYALSRWLTIDGVIARTALNVSLVTIAYPAILLASGFLDADERASLARLLRLSMAMPSTSAVAQKTIDALAWTACVTGLAKLCFIMRRLCRRHGVYVLSYHHVGADTSTSRHDVTTSQLNAHLAFVKRWFHVVPLAGVPALLARKSLDRDYLAITFDDGYEDNFDRALPLLRRHDLPATVFLIAGLPDTTAIPWYDEWRLYLPLLSASDLADAEPAVRPFLNQLLSIMSSRGSEDERIDRSLSAIKPMAPALRGRALDVVRRRHGPADALARASDFRIMPWHHVREMARHRVSFGCHTMTHPILTALPVGEIEAEVRESRQVMESQLGTSCTTFAYPNGEVDARAVAVLRAQGFTAACTQAFGANRPGGDPLTLKRVGVGRTSHYVLAAKLSGLFTPAFALREGIRCWTARARPPQRLAPVAAAQLGKSVSR